MQHLIIIWLLATLAIAVCSFVYTNILTAPGQIFFALHNTLEEKLPQWIFKPLIGCEKCNAGQLMLWLYLFFAWYYNQPYLWWLHIYLICQTILNVSLIKALYNHLTGEIYVRPQRARKNKFIPDEIKTKANATNQNY